MLFWSNRVCMVSVQDQQSHFLFFAWLPIAGLWKPLLSLWLPWSRCQSLSLSHWYCSWWCGGIPASPQKEELHADTYFVSKQKTISGCHRVDSPAWVQIPNHRIQFLLLYCFSFISSEQKKKLLNTCWTYPPCLPFSAEHRLTRNTLLQFREDDSPFFPIVPDHVFWGKHLRVVNKGVLHSYKVW